MAFVVNDRVKETTTDTGTTTIDLAGAETGFETFVAGIGSTNQTYYCIQAQGGSAFEIGVGTVTSGSPDTLSRTSVISSSNADGLVDFGSGTKDVFCTLPASKAVIEDNSTNANIAGNLTLGGTVDGVDIAARDAVLTSTTTTANAALPKAGGTMSGNLVLSGANITMSGSETVDGVDISARDTVLTNTTTTANAALPKAGGTMTGDIAHASDFTLDVGGDLILDADGGDIKLRDGGSGFGQLQNSSSDFVIQVDTQDKDIVFKGDDGGSAITALTLDMSSEGSLVVNSNVKYPDSGKAIFGAGSDLQIYHDGNDSYVRDAGTGNLRLEGNDVRVANADSTADYIRCTNAGAVDLLHNDSVKFSTSATGVSVTGTVAGDVVSAHPVETSFESTDLIAVYDTSASAIKKGTIANVALQGPAGSPGSNGSPGPPGPSGTITNTAYQMTALGVGTAAGPTGQIRATSNITAYYSDSRLKDFEGPIDSALDKVKALTGYYFKENDLARSFGYDNEKRQVGVSAQEVESVLPEVVTEAPFNSDYKSVWYEKLVPLLIEAIKELDDKKKDK
jgi:hypothetical protein